MKDAINLKRARLEGSIHKRVPQRAAAAVTDIYVSHKSKIPIIVKRIQHSWSMKSIAAKTKIFVIKLLNVLCFFRHSTITVHGMGAMLCRAIAVAQKTQTTLENQVELRVTTSTVTLIDDIVPDDMDEDIQTQQRQNSAIRIDLVAKPGLMDLQKKAAMIAQHPSRNRKLRR
ncbi:unnamed protein product [Absidia cylindrospora]